jgi:hypothetical protein
MTARTPRHVAGGLLVLGAALQFVAAQAPVPRYEVKRVSTPLDIMAVTASAGAAQSMAACAGPG